MHSARYANAPRCRNFLQTSSHIDAVAKDVVALNDDVTLVDADAEGYALVLGHLCAPRGHARLQFDRTAYGIDHARELQQQPVAGRLDDATAVVGDCRVYDLLAKALQRCQRAALVSPHQPR